MLSHGMEDVQTKLHSSWVLVCMEMQQGKVSKLADMTTKLEHDWQHGSKRLNHKDRHTTTRTGASTRQVEACLSRAI